MNNLEWQPITWHFFHTIALNYNEEYKDKYIIFFNTFKTIIPCKICREHFISNLRKPNMSIENNINSIRIFNWTIDLHNMVNKTNSRSLWKYDKAKEHYTKHNFENSTMKTLLLEYIKNNFKKDFNKTTELIKMINILPYLHPNLLKRNKLIEFKDKFELKRKNLKQWIISFLIILKS